MALILNANFNNISNEDYNLYKLFNPMFNEINVDNQGTVLTFYLGVIPNANILYQSRVYTITNQGYKYSDDGMLAFGYLVKIEGGFLQIGLKKNE